MTTGQDAVAEFEGARARRSWWRVLLIGFFLYVLGVMVLGMTLNPNLFPRESAAGRFRLTRTVIAAYLTVALLHGLWDALPSMLDVLMASGGNVMLGQTIVGVVSLALLGRRWREARRLQLIREGATC